MILLVGPAAGGVAHVAQRVADQWHASGVAVRQLVLSDDGRVAHPDIEEGQPAVLGELARSVPVAIRALWSVYRHRSCCLEGARSLHVELGRTTPAVFWFAMGTTFLRHALPVVVVAHDMPVVVKNPAASLVPTGTRLLSAVAYRIVAPLLDGFVMRLLRRRVDATVVLSKGAAEVALARVWPSVSVVVHGADAPTHPATDPGTASDVVLAGYLGPGKGLDVLAEAWRVVDMRGIPLSLVIVGSPMDADQEWVTAIRTHLDALVSPPQWLGHVTDADFASAIAKAAIVVLPYEVSNPASGPLIRALVEGRPVVASRVPAVQDEIVAGKNGLLVDPGDADQLADALSQLANSPALRRELGKQASAGAVRHTWPKHAEHLALVHANIAPKRCAWAARGATT